MSEMAHSETPWKLDDRTSKGEGFTIYSVTAHYSRANVAHYVSRSDAEFIVRACNARADLVEQLDGARAIVEKWCHYQGNTPELFDEFLAPIDAALSKARGEKT